MKILLTNDDGIMSEGLQVLVSVLEKEHEVWVVAPDRNRSAVSHSILMDIPLKIKKKAKRQYACSGVPVDCVVHGLRAILKGNPDCIISGINHGANLGTDILFSGTAAAARQGALYGIPSIALSLQSETGTYDFRHLADFVLKHLENILKLSERDVFVNINAMSPGPYERCVLTKPSRRTYNDGTEHFIAPDGQHYAFFKGGSIDTEDCERGDYQALVRGDISLSRIHAQPLGLHFDEELWEALCIKP